MFLTPFGSILSVIVHRKEVMYPPDPDSLGPTILEVTQQMQEAQRLAKAQAPAPPPAAGEGFLFRPKKAEEAVAQPDPALAQTMQEQYQATLRAEMEATQTAMLYPPRAAAAVRA